MPNMNITNSKGILKHILLASCGLVVIFLFAFLPDSTTLSYFSSSAHTEQVDVMGAAMKSLPRDIKLSDFDEDDRELEDDMEEYKIPNKNLLVVIDPGHGGVDPGTSFSYLLEKNITLDIGLKLNRILKKAGISTLMTREKDQSISLNDRISLANEKKAALFISIHCNSFTDPNRNGTMTLYYPSKTLAYGSLVEKEYAKIIQQELIAGLQTYNLGIADRPNLAVLRRAQMPSVITELGFLSNIDDVALLDSKVFRFQCAKSLAKGILKSLEKIG